MNSTVINEFDPVLFSKEENLWLLENIDKPPVVALQSIRPVKVPPKGRNKNRINYPDGVNPNAVKPFLERLQDLEMLKLHEGQDWVGKEAIKRAIRTYLEVDAKWEADNRRMRNAPRFPSLYSFDSKGRAHLGGPGSDSGRVRTYFDAEGNRVPFAIPLLGEAEKWAGPGFTEKVEDGLVVNAELNRIECFCGHTERFKPGARSSYSAARARISKHLRKATEEVERHREIHTNEFGS